MCLSRTDVHIRCNVLPDDEQTQCVIQMIKK